MEIPVALVMFAFGAILTFALRINSPALNLHIMGIILMIISAVGIYFSRRGSAWVRKVIVIPRRRRSGRRVTEIDEAIYPPYVKENPHAVPGAVVEPAAEPGDTTVAKAIAEQLADEG